MPAELHAPLAVDVVSSQQRLAELEEVWSHLHQRDAHASGWTEPHLLFEFQRMYFPAHRPLVLVARDGIGTVHGILPLAMEAHRVGPVYLRRVVPLANWQTCYPDAVIEPGTESTVMPALANALGQMAWDELKLLWVKPDSHLLHPVHGLAGGIPELRREPGLPLWIRALQGEHVLTREKTQKEGARRFRRLSERGAIKIGWEPLDRIVSATQEFVALHSRLKDHQKQRAYYRLGNAAGAFPEWMRHQTTAGRADLFAVRCDDTLIAGKIILRHRRDASSYRTAWEPGLATFGLGILIMTEAIEACRARGDLGFDLGPGVEAYKSEWASQSGQTTTLRATRNTWRSRLARRWTERRRRNAG
jgi:CelD/BcsL family acetyltransferase involved in cellulose biosynthesis